MTSVATFSFFLPPHETQTQGNLNGLLIDMLIIIVQNQGFQRKEGAQGQFWGQKKKKKKVRIDWYGDQTGSGELASGARSAACCVTLSNSLRLSWCLPLL